MSTATLEAPLAPGLVTCAMSPCPLAQSPVGSPKVDARSPPSWLPGGVPDSYSPEGRSTTQMRRRLHGDNARRLGAIHVGGPQSRQGVAPQSEADPQAVLDRGRNAPEDERGPAAKSADLLSRTLALSDER